MVVLAGPGRGAQLRQAHLDGTGGFLAVHFTDLRSFPRTLVLFLVHKRSHLHENIPYDGA